jgi:hypothetical protein
VESLRILQGAQRSEPAGARYGARKLGPRDPPTQRCLHDRMFETEAIAAVNGYITNVFCRLRVIVSGSSTSFAMITEDHCDE